MAATPSPAVLVTGATGQQGGALARILLEKGSRVRALTRNPDAPAAQELKGLGAEIAVGSFDDGGSLEKACAGADAVFAMGTPYEAGPEVEIRQGIALVDAAKAAGAGHLVYTSAGGADRKTGIPHFDGKFEVEEHIRSRDVPFTILGPVAFMENFLGPWFLPGLIKGSLAVALPAARPLQYIAVRDIAAFAALVIEEKEPFLGKRIDIAGDEITGERAAEILGAVTGRGIRYMEVPIEQLRAASEERALVYEWFGRVGYDTDIAALRRDYPAVGWQTFEDWAKAQDWSALRA